MKSRCAIAAIAWLIFGLFHYCLAQDCRVYTESNYGGLPLDLSLGDSVYISGPHDNLSFRLDKGAALLVKAAMPVSSEVENWDGVYHDLFFYSQETERPGMVGTDQWSNGNYAKWAYCVQPFNPEPPVYVPIDPINAQPGSDRHNIETPVAGKEYVFLKRAFFWENAEQLNCDLDPGEVDPHGPAGDIKIYICHPDVRDYPLWVLERHPHLWSTDHDCVVHCNGSNSGSDCSLSPNESVYDVCDYYSQASDIPIKKSAFADYTLLGPTYFAPPACDGSPAFPFFTNEYAPSPHNEWIDGPWGAYYQNFPLFDWQTPGIKDLDSVAILIVEADKEEFLGFSTGNFRDVLGYEVVRKMDTKPKIIPVGMAGWILVDKEKGQPDQHAESTDFYWYPANTSPSPELVLGPMPHKTLRKHLFTENDTLYFGCDDNQPGFCYALYKQNGENVMKYFFGGTVPTPVAQKRYVSVNSSQVPVDTFYRYVVCPSSTCPSLDTIDLVFHPVAGPITDTLYVEEYTYVNNHNILASRIVLYPNLNPVATDTTPGLFAYRVKGSQYNPFQTDRDVERLVPAGDSVSVYTGVIPAGNFLTEEMTYLPLDKNYKKDQSVIKQPAVSRAVNASRELKSRIALPAELFVYPNPVAGLTTVYLKCEEAATATLTLVNPYGRLLKNLQNGLFEKGFYEFSISREELAPGVNFIAFSTGKGVIVQKIVRLE